MSNNDELPTISQLVSTWFGFRLPTVTLPQTLRNIDKAIGKIILAGGENLEARIKGNTATTRAMNKLNIDGLFRTEEDKRKLENRVSATKAALENIDVNPTTADAPSEIEDDWLNFFARVSEDKSSEELQQLFGRVLSGEIRRPGSFSLRTIQLLSIISRRDAEVLSMLLSYAINGSIVPFETGESGSPTGAEHLFLEELGIASHPSVIGSMVLKYEVQPESKFLLAASHRGIMIENDTQQAILLAIRGQILTSTARELVQIANSPPTDIEFLRKVASRLYTDMRFQYTSDVDDKLLAIHVVDTRFRSTTPEGENLFDYTIIYTQDTEQSAPKPER